MKKTFTKIFASVMALAIILTAFAPVEAQAASKKTVYPTVTASNAKIAKIVKKSAKAYTVKLTVGQKAKLVVKASGKKVTKKAKYASSKKSVATVNKNGVVTAKKAGTAKIKVTYKNKTSVLTVTVKAKPAKKTTKPATQSEDTPVKTEHVHTKSCMKDVAQCHCGQIFNTSAEYAEHILDIQMAGGTANGHSCSSVPSYVCGY